MNRVDPDLSELLQFLVVPVTIKPMFPERTCYTISLVFLFVVCTLEGMSAWYFFWHFQSWRVDLEVWFAASYYVLMMLEFMMLEFM